MAFECFLCNKSFASNGNLNKHLRTLHKDSHEEANCHICECNKIFESAQSLNAHYRWCLIHRNGTMPVPSHWKGISSPRRGKRLKDIVKDPEETRRKIAISRKGISIPHSSETKRKLSEARITFLESDKSHVQWYTVGGIKVQGTWEKCIAEKLYNDGIVFNRKRIKYDVHRTYTPDFYLNDFDVYLEVKGWLSERDISKYKKVLTEHPSIKIYLIRNFCKMHNFTKVTNGVITVFDCEDLREVIFAEK